jgi:hypothetical protein
MTRCGHGACSPFFSGGWQEWKRFDECWASIFDTGSPMYSNYAKNIVFTGVMEQCRIQVDEDLLRDMDEPLDNFMVQFKTMKKRDAERTRRKVDSDRLLYDYEKLQRAGKDLEKVEPLRLQSEGMQLYYERLNNELKRDVPLLIDDRANFYTPLFANWIFHIHEYYRMAYENISPLAQAVLGVDLSTLHTHPAVITSEEASYYNVEIKDVTPDDMDAGPMSSVMSDQHNPNGGYQQQPYSQAPAAYGQSAAATSYPNARALYAFVGQDGTELSFSEGEIIAIVAQVKPQKDRRVF